MTPSSTAARRPTVDEWGVYDPQQAGLAAVFTRLTTTHEPRPEQVGPDAASRSLAERLPLTPPTR